MPQTYPSIVIAMCFLTLLDYVSLYTFLATWDYPSCDYSAVSWLSSSTTHYWARDILPILHVLNYFWVFSSVVGKKMCTQNI